MSQTTDVSVIVRLIDKLSGPAKTAATALKGIEKSANNLKGTNVFGNMSKDIAGSSRSLDKMRGDIRALSSTLRTATLTSQGLSRAISKPANSNGFSGQVRQLQQIIKLQQQSISLNSRMGGGGRGPGFNLGGRRNGGHGGVFSMHGMGMMYAAERVGHFTKDVFESAGSLEMEKRLLDARGWSEDIKRRMMVQAKETSRLVPQISEAQALHGLGEISYAGGSPDFGIANLTQVAKANQVINAAHLGEGKGHQFQDQMMEIIKSGEMKNYISDPAAFKWWLDSTVNTSKFIGLRPGQGDEKFAFSEQRLHC